MNADWLVEEVAHIIGKLEAGLRSPLITAEERIVLEDQLEFYKNLEAEHFDTVGKRQTHERLEDAARRSEEAREASSR